MSEIGSVATVPNYLLRNYLRGYILIHLYITMHWLLWTIGWRDTHMRCCTGILQFRHVDSLAPCDNPVLPRPDSWPGTVVTLLRTLLTRRKKLFASTSVKGASLALAYHTKWDSATPLPPPPSFPKYMTPNKSPGFQPTASLCSNTGPASSIGRA